MFGLRRAISSQCELWRWVVVVSGPTGRRACDCLRSTPNWRRSKPTRPRHGNYGNTLVAQRMVLERFFILSASYRPIRASVILAGLGFSPRMQQQPTKWVTVRHCWFSVSGPLRTRMFSVCREFSGGWRMRLALARALFARWVSNVSSPSGHMIPD